MGRSIKPQWLIHCSVLLLLSLGLHALHTDSNIAKIRILSDASQNFRLATNLAMHSQFTTNLEKPNYSRREPFVPYVASWFFKLEDRNLLKKCATLNDDSIGKGCEELHTKYFFSKKLLYLGLPLIFYFSMLALGLGGLSSFAVSFLITATLPIHQTHYLTNYLSELEATFFLSAFGLFFLLATKARWKKSWPHIVLAAASLSCLILNKAIFLYFLPMLCALGGCAFLFIKKKKDSGSFGIRCITIAALALLLVTPWLYRNYERGQGFTISKGRAAAVLAIRANYNTMDFEESMAALAYWNGFSPRTIASHYPNLHRANKKGYYQSAKKDERAALRAGPDAYRKYKSDTINRIVDNWFQHGLKSILFTIRGVKSVNFPLNLIVLLGFFVFIWRSYRTLNIPEIAFAYLAFFSHASYTAMTQYIPRFAIPIVPTMWICTFIILSRNHRFKSWLAKLESKLPQFLLKRLN